MLLRRMPHLPSPFAQGAANSTCFRKLARFYAKDVKLMFPALHSSWGEEGQAVVAGHAAAAGADAAGSQQVWRRSQLWLD